LYDSNQDYLQRYYKIVIYNIIFNIAFPNTDSKIGSDKRLLTGLYEAKLLAAPERSIENAFLNILIINYST
jgi:hypothetical protein